MTENLNLTNSKSKIQLFLSKIRITRFNFGWWVLGFILSIGLVGGIISLFNPSVTYFDAYIWFINLFFLPFGQKLDSIDYRITPVLEGLGTALPMTIIISLIAVILGFLIAIMIAILLVQKGYVYGLKILAQIYIDFFRSTPLLVQILLVYFSLPEYMIFFLRSFNIPFISTETYAGVLALALNTAAYQAEIIRGGILAIPVGQTEAARGLGMTTFQTMRYVILPQAVRIIVPPLTNESINVILNSSLVSAIGVIELTKKSQSLQARYALWQAFLLAAVFYFVITFTLSKLTKRMEVKLRIPGLGVAND